MARESFKPTPRDRSKTMEIDTSGSLDGVIVNLDLEGPESIQIVEIDDIPEADRGRPTNVDDLAEPRDPSNYQKRIDRIRAETHTERRRAEQAEREREVATEVARQARVEVEELRRRLDSSNTILAASMKGDRQNRLADAQRRLSVAHSDGDSDAIAKATSDIAGAQAELVQIASRTPAPRPPNQPQQKQQPVQQRPAAQLSPDAAAWVGFNGNWWGRDKVRTEFALAANKTILGRGVKDTSPEYTRELDKAMKAVYPDHQSFGRQADDGSAGGSTPRRTNVVAEGGRENPDAPKNPRTVGLTPTEIASARVLGLTTPRELALYAIEKQKRDSRSAQK